jgi:hypothetical protein
MLDKRDVALSQRINILANLAEEAGRQGTRRLSENLNLNVESEECKVDLIPRSEIVTRFAVRDIMAAAVFTHVFGELPGYSFVLIQRDSVLRIISEAIGAKPERPVSLSAFTPQIVLKQMGEILSITFFEGLAILLQQPSMPRLSAPEVFFDTWDNTLERMAQQISTESDNLYTFHLRFCCIIGKERFPATHIYFVDQEMLKQI